MARIDPASRYDSKPARLHHRFLPRTLFARSLLIIAVPVILLQVIVTFIFFDRHWDNTSSKLAQALGSEIAYIARQMQAAPDDAAREKIATSASNGLGLTVALAPDQQNVSPARGDPFARYAWFSVGPKLEEEIARRLNVPFVVRPYEREKWFVVEIEYLPGKILSVLSHERRLVSSTTYIFILWLIGSAFVLFSISILFMRNQIRPILRLAVAAEKLGRGQDVPDFKPVGAMEIRKAAQAFIRMKERLRRQLEQRTLMLAGVSHDLRTPLTRMKLQLAMAPAGSDNDSLKEDIAEMEQMVEGYLAFAKGEGDEPSVMTDLGSIITRIAANTARTGQVVQVALPEGAQDRLMLRIRPMALERAIGNVVNNASQYAQNVWLTVRILDEDAEIIVDDDGPGIPATHRETVFRPFYRLEKSRNKKTGGVGLGLSITQDIVHGHGGEVILADSPHGGLRVIMRLPI